MCGIGALLSPEDSPAVDAWVQAIGDSLSPRGPDHSGRVEVKLGSNVTAHLLASVLHLRGHVMRCQPAVDDGQGNVLCWNGEVFACRGPPTAAGHPAFEVSDGESDTEVLLQQLRAAPAGVDFSDHLRDVLATVEGPYAFIYFRAETQCLYYGRDPLGRRSLMSTQDPTSGSIILSSVACVEPSTKLIWKEVDVRGFYCRSGLGEDVQEQFIPWQPWQVSFPRLTTPDVTENEPIPPPQEPNSEYTSIEAAAHGLLRVLDAAVQKRIQHIQTVDPAPGPDAEADDGAGGARLAVLFSGGIDSMVVACLAHRHVAPQEPIDLINVCFDRETPSPDRLGAIAGRRELQARHPERVWRLLLVDLDYEEVKTHEDHIKRLIMPCATPMDFNIACAFWFASRGVGVIFHDDGAPVPHDTPEPIDGKTGLLRYATAGSARREYTEEEEEEAVQQNEADQEEGKAQCPAPRCRRTLKKGCVYGICRNCCLQRQRQRDEAEEGEGIRCRVHKLKPRKPKGGPQADGAEEKEDSKATGKEVSVEREEPPSPPPEELPPSAVEPVKAGDVRLYRSCARVLLLGVGADEQMGGYGRHRAAFEKRGFAGLEKELALDQGRLWTRNLGRDDRCVSDNGRESRLPFLDEQVVAFLQSLPLRLKCEMREPLGVGDKKILREVAGPLLGLPSCARLVKRAIQFGTRIARAANIHHFGSHRAGKGQRWKRGNKWTLGAEAAEEDGEET